MSNTLVSATESGLATFADSLGFSGVTWASLGNTLTSWWDGSGGSLGAKTYVGAVGAGLGADAKAVYHASQAAVNVGSGLTSALTSSWGPLLMVAIVIVIVIVALKVT